MLTAKEAYDLVASSYDKSYLSKTALVEDEVIYGFLKGFLKQSSVLDLGCGTGAFPEHVSVSMFDYIGLDISSEMIKKAKEKLPNHFFRVCDITKTPFPDNRFDNVISLWGGISYAGPKAIKEALRVLKPKGHYFFMLMNEGYEKRKSYILARHGLHVPFHTPNEFVFPAGHKKRGFNFFGDFPNWLPKSLIRTWFWLERFVKRFYARALILIVYGEKA